MRGLPPPEEIVMRSPHAVMNIVTAAVLFWQSSGPTKPAPRAGGAATSALGVCSCYRAALTYLSTVVASASRECQVVSSMSPSSR